MHSIYLVFFLILTAYARNVFSEDRSELSSSSPPTPTLAEAMNDLKSSDLQKRNAAEKVFFDLDPILIETVRKSADTNAFLVHFLEMHDKLVAEPGKNVRMSTVIRNVQEALQFFSSNGAVKILTTGLQSPDVSVRYRTALALSSADGECMRKHRKFIASAIVSSLKSHHIILQGGEDVVIQQKTNKLLTRLLGVLLDLTLENQTTEKCLQLAEIWLQEH